jgi:transcriptional regulator with XRE-family HTH domain
MGLKEIRESRGITVEALSQKTGIPGTTIWKLQAGANKKLVLRLAVLAKELGCTIEDLYREDKSND